MRPGKRRALDKKTRVGNRARVEHPFRVIKRQFGHVKVRYRGLAKNTAQLYTLFALSNLWMVRGQLLPAKGCVRAKVEHPLRPESAGMLVQEKNRGFSLKKINPLSKSSCFHLETGLFRLSLCIRNSISATCYGTEFSPHGNLPTST